MVWLRLIHIVAGVVWVGSAVFAALFVFPTARALGPDGRRFIERLQRRMGPALGLAMVLTVIPGFIMYGRLSAGFNRAWVTSRPGLALGAGAVAALLAVVMGIATNAPDSAKIARLRKDLDQRGGAATRNSVGPEALGGCVPARGGARGWTSVRLPGLGRFVRRGAVLAVCVLL